MKKLYFLFLALCISFSVKAQDDPNLLGTWYLHYIETNGTTLYAQISSFPLEMIVTSSSNIPAISGSSTCNPFLCDYQVNNSNTSIDISNFDATLAFCPSGNPELQTFELTYFGILASNNISSLDYTIDLQAETLTMIDLLGEKLVYGRQTLSTKDNEAFSSSITLYPNPVQKQLFMTGISPNTKASYTIYGLTGNVIVAERALTQSSLDVTQLKAGMYFIKLQQGGKTAVKKFVKL